MSKISMIVQLFIIGKSLYVLLGHSKWLDNWFIFWFVVGMWTSAWLLIEIVMLFDMVSRFPNENTFRIYADYHALWKPKPTKRARIDYELVNRDPELQFQ